MVRLIMGANGAGKTTTLMAISGLVDAAEGQILLDDMDITDCRPNSIVQMGVCHVPEGRHVFPELSVYENLVDPLQKTAPRRAAEPH